MNRILISICLSNLFAFIPHDFSIKGLNDMNQNIKTRDLQENLADDSIVDLRWLLDSNDMITKDSNDYEL